MPGGVYMFGTPITTSPVSTSLASPSLEMCEYNFHVSTAISLDNERKNRRHTHGLALCVHVVYLNVVRTHLMDGG